MLSRLLPVKCEGLDVAKWGHYCAGAACCSSLEFVPITI